MMLVQNEFDIGETVYLKTDTSQTARLITAIKVFPNNVISYDVVCGNMASSHFDFEMSKEKNILVEA